ncbi:FHA domain-containing protein [Ideonella dechloratans]|jgi:pSer/pThr/pTyr-binding forkhead associated (FHA) protein|uniref:FHA domain-containing protein n=1 Tax=Ideonella dechloratans TaxID=36863 RepID=A0A643FA75_IDEDE|nr:FHA domain-containing protein [Ideonella dechloratans]KAB0580741.1 FHA domain-containing protein [Ideonella dechloratans]UFU09949.1 FHA domain-containing protein [Ideonella dechloratans]
MGKLVVSLDNVVLKEVVIQKERTTLGRRPYNDIVIDNLAVSGEHAVLLSVGEDVFIEDLNSTNGTYINGKAIKKQLLSNGDVIEIGKYRIKYIGAEVADYEKTMVLRPGSLPPPAPPLPTVQMLPASIKVLNGGAAGREVLLTKAVTTVGKPGTQVASIAKRPTGYVLAHVEGDQRPTVNGSPLGEGVVPLKNGDIIELAGTQMQFIQG